MKPKNGAYLAIVVALLTSAALACGSSSSGPSVSNPTTFARVCSRGEGVGHDAYYGSAADGAGPFPVLVFRRAGEGEPWLKLLQYDLGSDFPSDWHPAETELTELVVCLTVVDREVAMECPYTAMNDESQTVELILELYNTTYDVSLRNAETAEEYATTTFQSMAAEECPETAIETRDQDIRVIDANPAPELIPFLEPWVEE